jgi:hypothetical protein
MKYILDKNILTRNLKENIQQRKDLCITQDVIDESGFTRQDIARIKEMKLQVLKFHKIHFEKLKQVMEESGDNLNLLNLYLGEGAADIMMIAYILAERELDKSMFPEEFIIVTKDAELTKVAQSYGINSIPEVS